MDTDIGLHGLMFLIAGLNLAWIVSQFERNPQIGMVHLLRRRPEAIERMREGVDWISRRPEG
jgi:hypothetical protein